MSSDDASQHLGTQVRAWIDDDPDPTTAAELTALLARAEAPVPAPTPGPEDPRRRRALADAEAARAELVDRFSGLLEFGTAGLRGAMGGGPNRMNRSVVIRAAAGLGQYLLAELEGLAPAPRVVVGYDARHRSHDFAVDSVAVLTAIGVEALLLPSPLPTPVLAFAVRHLDADAGIMVTASHNPAADNGYKVYLGGRVANEAARGSQIVPPVDAAIAAHIAHVRSVASVPRAASGWRVLGTQIVDEYVAAAGSAVVTTPADVTAAADLRIVLTPMHGVGAQVAVRVLAEAGFTHVTLVPEQAEPDPDFPTVAFPNPEEPGALDLALGLARDEQADLVLALDPDADRCAVGVLDRRARTFHGPETAAAEGWRALHGDETGALLGWAVAERLAGRPGATLAASIVSSRQLERIAADHGLAYASTLTGFKWISRVEGLVFGYEEALGYCVDPDHVHDKDGISAALRVARLAASLKVQGRTLLDLLDDLARRYGLYLSGQVAARFDDTAGIGAAVDRMRAAPPTRLAGSPVVRVDDLAAGTDDDRGGLPPTEGLRLLTEDGTRVVVRPSGTEPKVKCYLEVVVPVAPDASDHDVTVARTAARGRLDTLTHEVRRALGL